MPPISAISKAVRDLGLPTVMVGVLLAALAWTYQEARDERIQILNRLEQIQKEDREERQSLERALQARLARMEQTTREGQMQIAETVQMSRALETHAQIQVQESLRSRALMERQHEPREKAAKK